jgi:hypothetical protein
MKKSRFAGSFGALFMVCALCGCGTVQPPAVPSSSNTVNFDKGLLEDCKKLPHLKSSTDVDVNAWIASVTEIHIECAETKRKENEQIKKALNIVP